MITSKVTECWYALRKGDPTLTAIHEADEAERYRQESTVPYAIQHVVITSEISDAAWPGWEPPTTPTPTPSPNTETRTP